MTADNDRLLLVLPLPFARSGDRVVVEAQAINGFARWLEHFSSLTVIAPIVEEAFLQKFPSTRWEPIDRLPEDARKRLRFVGLPWAFRPTRYLRALKTVRATLRDEIASHQHLCFAIGTYWGDWGWVGAEEAHRMQRRHAVWFDRVEYDVWARTPRSFPRNVQKPLDVWLMRRMYQRSVRRAQLCLCHGREVYDALSPLSTNAHVVHNIHLKKSDRLDRATLDVKLNEIRSDREMRIVYAGRAADMKGPLDWIEALALARDAGAKFRASWLGDGERLHEMRKRVSDLRLSDVIDLPGFVGDRKQLLEAVRTAHAMVFCHKTPESPRVLIEALVSGTPLVGYDSSFPRDLIATHGGGRLVPLDNVGALGATITMLAADRTALADLAERAWHDGEPYNDEAVFAHRAHLIRAIA